MGRNPGEKRVTVRRTPEQRKVPTLESSKVRAHGSLGSDLTGRVPRTGDLYDLGALDLLTTPTYSLEVFGLLLDDLRSIS